MPTEKPARYTFIDTLETYQEATAVLKQATPALNQATTMETTNKPPVVPPKQPWTEQRKEISLEDVRSINELLERCISPGSTPPIVRSKSAGTVPVVQATTDVNLAATREGDCSGEGSQPIQSQNPEALFGMITVHLHLLILA
jgi:hypothetical protein